TTASPSTHVLSLHDALPIFRSLAGRRSAFRRKGKVFAAVESQHLAGEGGHGQDGQHRAGNGFRAGMALEEEGVDGPLEFGLGLRSEEHTSELQSRENLVCRL